MTSKRGQTTIPAEDAQEGGMAEVHCVGCGDRKVVQMIAGGRGETPLRRHSTVQGRPPQGNGQADCFNGAYILDAYGIKYISPDPKTIEKLEAPLREIAKSLRQQMEKVGSPRLETPERKLKVFFLTAPHHVDTLRLAQPIRNDLPAAFVQGQRYVTLKSLQEQRTTSKLESPG